MAVGNVGVLGIQEREPNLQYECHNDLVWWWRVEQKMAAVATVAYKYLVVSVVEPPKIHFPENIFIIMMILVNTAGSYCSAQNAQQYVTLPFLLVS